MLPPAELEGLFFGEVLLHTVVGPLDQHVVETGTFEKVGRCWRHPERIWKKDTIKMVHKGGQDSFTFNLNDLKLILGAL